MKKLKEGKPSQSAEMCASGRAVESFLPEAKRVCYDPLAEHFLSVKYRILLCYNRHLRNLALSYVEHFSPGAYGESVARTRYIDECLDSCINNGIDQLVILGAGYDSRAYRIPDLAKEVKVFEVDIPTTQQVKINKIKKIYSSLPSHVVYVPVDFAREKLDEKLFECGFDKKLKTLFIWEGVSMYLSTEAVDEILAFLANNSGAGSSIIMDYYYKSAIEGTSELEEARKMQESHGQLGEPFIFGIAEEGVDSFFTSRGFTQVNSVTGEFLEKEYFKKIGRNTKVPYYYGITQAFIKS